ncbi:MAG: hypothetical protein H8K09_13175 [Nitrospira sp.]|nr:hypothetical protein [Nitrospira sp.]
MSYKEMLLGLSSETQATMPYAELCVMRSSAFAEHVGAMEVPTRLKEWAAIMQARYGRKVKVWHAVQTSWLVALMIVRYGEAIEHWPGAFSDDDVRRAVKWEQGEMPAGVTYIPQADGLQLACYAVALLCVALGIIHGSGFWGLAAFPFLLGTAMTDYLENKLADHIFRTTTFTQPSVLAMALYTAAPGETGGGTEVSGGSYARVSNNPANANWNGTHGNTTGASSGTGGQVSNAGAMTFPTPSANWGSVTHFGIHDATSAGNLLIYGALTAAKTVNNGDPAPSFQAAALTVTFA